MPEKKRLFLHICCAPDGTVPWPALRDEGYEATGFFYGDNIHPEAEWLKRRDAVAQLAGILKLPLVTAHYDPAAWLAAVKNLAEEPEGGARCALCFELQFQSAARFAVEKGFDALCTTLTISPHKNPALINEIGGRVAESAGVAWVPRVWRKNEGFKLSVARSREWNLYRQDYCGCVYSRR